MNAHREKSRPQAEKNEEGSSKQDAEFAEWVKYEERCLEALQVIQRPTGEPGPHILSATGRF